MLGSGNCYANLPIRSASDLTRKRRPTLPPSEFRKLPPSHDCLTDPRSPQPDLQPLLDRLLEYHISKYRFLGTILECFNRYIYGSSGTLACSLGLLVDAPVLSLYRLAGN